MKNTEYSPEVVIIGGSYAGLAAAMSLGRARRNVLVIDGGQPCNRQTPHAHNLITHDGDTPAAIRNAALEQLRAYPTVRMVSGLVARIEGSIGAFTLRSSDGGAFTASRILIATGIRDIPPAIDGFSECWGISVLHCPYCHGYEVRDAALGVLGNGDTGFEFARLIRHWTPDLRLFTNGPAAFSAGQLGLLQKHEVRIEERQIRAFRHDRGQLQAVVFEDETELPVTAVFARAGMEQHGSLAEDIGCELQTDGMFPALIKVDAFARTSVAGIYAAGDNSSPFRSLANAIAAGTTTGAIINNELIVADF